MTGVTQDYYGHLTPTGNGPNGANFTGATSGTAAGTIVIDGTIVTAAPTAISANDTAGQFKVTIATGTSHGKIATVYYAQPLAAAPKAIIVSAYDTTTNTVSNGIGQALANVTQGFDVTLTATGTAADVFLIQYLVIL